MQSSDLSALKQVSTKISSKCLLRISQWFHRLKCDGTIYQTFFAVIFSHNLPDQKMIIKDVFCINLYCQRFVFVRSYWRRAKECLASVPLSWLLVHGWNLLVWRHRVLHWRDGGGGGCPRRRRRPWWAVHHKTLMLLGPEISQKKNFLNRLYQYTEVVLKKSSSFQLYDLPE